MKKFFMTFVSVLCCTMAMTMFVACSEDDNSGGVVPGVDSRIVGNWCSKVTGMTYAKWNYGDAWQNREFNSLLTESLLSGEAGANSQQSK